jgi:NAD(P)-dependent dehydrogenase (short-subunit alcohol dehydrogenase family)
VVAVASSEASLEALGTHENLVTAAIDLTTEEGAARMVAWARGTIGAPDTLLHLVGTFGMASTADAEAPEVFERMLRVNLHSAYHCFRAMVPALRETGGGHLVGVSARAARAPGAKMAAYAASKAALEAVAKSMAEELRPENIHVNLVATSIIDTPANRNAMGDKNAGDWVSPAQLADAIDYLVSREASGVHGAILDVFNRA